MKTVVRAAGEGEKLWFSGGGVHTWKVTAAETQGAVGMFEDVLERGKTTPLHVHPESDEIIYVLDGEILVHDGGTPRTVGRGAVVLKRHDRQDARARGRARQARAVPSTFARWPRRRRRRGRRWSSVRRPSQK